jgi:hypothetical protein
MEVTKQPIKTKSQVLRAVLFKWWEQDYKEKYTFEEFYQKVMDKLITRYIEKLK